MPDTESTLPEHEAPEHISVLQSNVSDIKIYKEQMTTTPIKQEIGESDESPETGYSEVTLDEYKKEDKQ